MTIDVHLRVDRPDLHLGLVIAEGISVGPAPAPLEEALRQMILRRQGELAPSEEAARLGSRDVLRNGRYKPTGRGKPASEYLQRAAKEGAFPRINGPVDALNLVSLTYCVPISLWDLDLAGSERFEFRLGGQDETYVFNTSGQTLGLRDLVVGCAVDASGDSRPFVSPIKDSMAAKVADTTTRAVGCIYYPAFDGVPPLDDMMQSLGTWLGHCGADVRVASWALRC